MKFKNGLTVGAQISLIFNVLFSLICFVAFLFDKNFKMFIFSLLVFTFIIWLIYFICMLFSKKIYITEKNIVAKRFKRVVWVVEKEEIVKIKYNGGSVLDVLLGDAKAMSVMLYTKENSPWLQRKFYKLNYLSFFCNKKNFEKIKKMGYEVLMNSQI